MKCTLDSTGFNADFVTSYDVGDLASPLNFAFGFELREETYKIDAGDPASIGIGPTFAVFGVGSDGFQGFPTESAGSFNSESLAGYLDLEADITDRFSAGAAIRYEDFDEFGNTFDWKLSGRVQVTDTFALRATANTGFRAPTPGQVNTLNVTTTADPSGRLIPLGTYPVNGLVARTLGAIPLTPEESTSLTLGAIFSPWDNTSITLDYYDIQIDDRLALRSVTVNAMQVADLAAAGVPNPDTFLGSGAGYFTNAFDSNVSGIDLAITSDFDVGLGLLIVDLRHNFNEQKVKNVAPETILAARVFDLENYVPERRTTLSLNYQTDGMFGGYVRINNYGGWAATDGVFGDPTDVSNASFYGSEVLVDVEATFTFNDRYRITVGGENVFDTDPDPEQGGLLRFFGVRRSVTSPFGFNGAFWYVRVSADF